MMNEKPFQRSHLPAWIFIAVMMGVPIISIWFTQGSFWRAPTSKSGWPLVLFDIAIVLVFIYICLRPIFQLRTKYTDDGIEQPSLFHTEFLKWQDVQELRFSEYRTITLMGPEEKITIGLIFYRNPKTLLAEIRSRIPQSAIPSETQRRHMINRQMKINTGLSALGVFLIGFFVILSDSNEKATLVGGLLITFAAYQAVRWIRFVRSQ